MPEEKSGIPRVGPAVGGTISRARIAYREDPDYTRPLPEIPLEARQKMLGRLRFLYGKETADRYFPELVRILRVHCAHKPQELIQAEKGLDPRDRFTQRDMILITYGDMVEGTGHSPLASLHKFVTSANRGAINTLHPLPFSPYSSDREFSMVDYTRVDPKLGTWEDIRNMGLDYALMFDGVLNHCSSRSRMFRHFLNGNPHYQDFFSLMIRG